jgi:hypothetical protein
MPKKFPDLNKDGKITQADVLKGRGVFNDGGEVDNYIQLYQQMQMSLGQAETEEDKNKIRERFEQSTQGFDQSIIMQAFKKLDAMRDSKAMGSLLVPPERKRYGKGKFVTQLVDFFKSKKPDSPRVEEGQNIDDESFEKMLTTPNKDALFFSKKELNNLKKEVPEADAYSEMIAEFAMIREIDDEIIKKGEALGYNRKKIKSILEGKQSDIDKLRVEFNNLTEKQLQKAEDSAARDDMAMGSLMVPPEREGYGKGGALIKIWKALGKEASHQDKELAQEVLDNSPKSKRHSDREYVTRTAFSFGEDYNTDLLLKKDIPEGSQEFKDKFVRAWRSRAKTFSHDGEKYVVEEGKPEIKNERNAKGKGGPILDLVAAITGKQTKAAKKKMVDEEKALQDLSRMVEDNPRVLDELSDEDYEMVVSKLPQSQAAKMGMADEPLDDMVEMARGMAPADVAKNLEMFNSIEDIFEYAEGLDAKDARQFMDNLSDEDLAIFGGDLPDVGATLGPREVKADGGPIDTYNNISPEEEMQQAEDMLPDDEMEEEYVDYVAEEVLEPEEQEYLFKVLDEDPRLEGILDKIILNATEFAGSGEVEGPGTGISDSIPARLSDGEFVITRKATDQIGADNLQKMMDDAERAYDGGLMGMATGGEAGTNPFVNPEEMYKLPKDEEADIERQMLYSSRMPSLMNR